jgi:hypothetical protein
MARSKIDGVVEAVHYSPGGQVNWVRAYLRRGPTFTDRLIIDRQTLIDHLRSGHRLFTGRRVPYEASTFELTKPLRLIQDNGKDVLVAGEASSEKDCLDGVPVI